MKMKMKKMKLHRLILQFFNKKFSISNDKELIANILDQYLIGSYLKDLNIILKQYLSITSQALNSMI